MSRIYFFPAPATGGGGTPGTADIQLVTVDFGSTPVKNAKFSGVAVTGVAAGTQVMVMQTFEAAPGRSADENEMDFLQCRAVVVGTNLVDIYVSADPGPVQGQYVLALLAG